MVREETPVPSWYLNRREDMKASAEAKVTGALSDLSLEEMRVIAECLQAIGNTGNVELEEEYEMTAEQGAMARKLGAEIAGLLERFSGVTD